MKSETSNFFSCFWLFCLFACLLWPCCVARGILVPCPIRDWIWKYWKYWVITTEPPRNSLLLTLYYFHFVSLLSLSQFILTWTSYSWAESNIFLLSYILRGYNFCKKNKRLTLGTALLLDYQWIQSKFLHLWWKFAI